MLSHPISAAPVVCTGTQSAPTLSLPWMGSGQIVQLAESRLPSTSRLCHTYMLLSDKAVCCLARGEAAVQLAHNHEWCCTNGVQVTAVTVARSGKLQMGPGCQDYLAPIH